jgi:hypothetical protein
MTLNELYRLTLARMQVAADGEPAQPGDIATVRARYSVVFELLNAKGLADWDAEDDIPPDAGFAVSLVLAAYCSEEFFVPEPRKSTLKAEGYLDLPSPSLAERTLKNRNSSKYLSQPAKAEYY